MNMLLKNGRMLFFPGPALIFLALALCFCGGGDGPEEDGDADGEVAPADADAQGDSDQEGETTVPETCGNGIIESGEECDSLERIECTTSCGTTGYRICDLGCRLSDCFPPAEDCSNSEDDDCDTFVDYDKAGGDRNITNNPATSRCPVIAWSGSEFGVAYLESDTPYGAPSLMFARIDSSGAAAGDAVVVASSLSTSSREACSTLMTWDGANYLVVWEIPGTYSTDGSIMLARYDSDGEKAGDNITAARTGDSSRSSAQPEVTRAGSEIGFVWNQSESYDSAGIYFARLSESGEKIGSDIRITDPIYNATNPTISWTGSEFAVAWEDDRDGVKQIYCTRLDSLGTKLMEDNRVTINPGNSSNPRSLWTGSGLAVAWEDDRDGVIETYFARLDVSCDKIGSDIRIDRDPTPSVQFSFIWTGSEYAFSWQDNIDDSTHESLRIFMARFDADGEKLSLTVAVDQDSHGSLASSLAWTGLEFGVAWQDRRDENEELYFTRIACN
ncbi:MAG: hypothetical protein ABIJ56_10845 [Pseudomonadota bacterium]